METKFDNPNMAIEQAGKLSDADWALLRKPEDPESKILSADALVWLRRVPAQFRPVCLSRRYPRIVNKMSEVWGNVSKAQDYFDDLMLDRRGGRQGFPLEIVMEISDLRTYYEEILHPNLQQNAWATARTA